MNMLKISKVDIKNNQDLKKFIFFPFALYKDCPQWVPPMIGDMYKSFNPQKHPFFQHSHAKLFIAEENNTTLGRIAVFNNRRYNDSRKDSTAFFGFYDVIEDEKVSNSLFDAAFDWSNSQGLDRIIGPRGLIGADSGGILVEGFELRAAMGVPYNYPYYDELITSAGFEKDTDHLSGYLPGDHALPERLFRIAEKIKSRRGYWVKSFTTREEMKAWVLRVREVHRKAFGDSHTYYPTTDAEMNLIADTLLRISDPGLIKLIMREDRLIGFIFAYHDITAGIQKAKGRILPLGWIHILKERNRTNWVNINGVGVLPAFQGTGANAILYTALDKTVKEFGFEHMEIVQVNETNFNSRSDMETMGVQWYKRHRSYKREL
jgi:hypothetical protein